MFFVDGEVVEQLRIRPDGERILPWQRSAEARTVSEVRKALRHRLESRREEIEQAAVARIQSIADSGDADPLYREGLRLAVSAAFAYAFEVIEHGEERAPAPPPPLLVQARMAARHGIDLGIVLRRYLAGYVLLGEYLIGELGESGLATADLQDLVRGQAAIFDKLLAVVADEYTREARAVASSSRQRQGERVDQLLAGQLIDTTGLDYEFDHRHVGLVCSSRAVEGTVRSLARELDCRLLLVGRDDGSIWAWFGTRHELTADRIVGGLNSVDSGPWAAAVGEPACGVGGWRLTHQQALAALPLAKRGDRAVVRYGDVSLLAAIVNDDLLSASVRELYLEPLSRPPDDGAILKDTLATFFACDCNVSSTAAALKVNRNTVSRRLQVAEELLGRPVPALRVELETALKLDGLTGSTDYGRD
jgi:PucR-like helix-turn-helix protein/diguanylate cyclase with GGDEF domain